MIWFSSIVISSLPSCGLKEIRRQSESQAASNRFQIARFRRCSASAPELGFQVRFACFFCNIFWKTSLWNPARGWLYVAWAGSLGTFLVATEGGTRSRPVLRWFAGIYPLSSGRGEGAKMLSSVPGGHIWGHGGPAQHPRVNAQAGSTRKARLSSSLANSGRHASLEACDLISARSVPQLRRWIPRSLADIDRLQA